MVDLPNTALVRGPLPSIRTRLSRALVVISLAWGVMLSLTVGLLLHKAVDKLLDSGLQESAEILYGMTQLGAADGDVPGGMLPAPRHQEALVWQVVRPDGEVTLRSHQAPEQALAERLDTGFSSTLEWRIYSLPLPEGRGMLHVAQRESVRADTQLEIMVGIVGGALLVGFSTTLWLRARLRRELAPLQALSIDVARYDPMAPGAGLPAAARAELSPMVDAIGALGQRLSAHVAHERAFAAHAAHALRTPLAGIDAQLAVALREAPAELAPRLRQTREAAARLRSVVSALISLFRAGGEMKWQRVSLPELVGRLPVRGVNVTVDAPQPLVCDPDLMSAALMNLLDNAARHQARDVAIRVAPQAGGVLIEVTDNGQGMSPDRLLQVQSALATGAKDGVLGLGLTLTDLVMRTHGGAVQVCSGPVTNPIDPAAVQGTVVRLSLPAKAVDPG